MNDGTTKNKDFIIDSFVKEQKKLYLTALSITNNSQNAEDAMQECFLKIIKKYEQLKNTEHCKTWMTRILINTCKDLLRKKAAVDVCIVDVCIDNVTSVELSSFDNEERRFFDLVSGLIADEKEIVTLHYFNELTFEEISKVIGKPLSTIKSHFYRALEKLKKEWSE